MLVFVGVLGVLCFCAGGVLATMVAERVMMNEFDAYYRDIGEARAQIAVLEAKVARLQQQHR